MNQQVLRKQTRDGKLILPQRRDAWDIDAIMLPWILTVLVTAIVTFCWIDGGPAVGMLASAMGAIIVWKEGPK